MKNLNYFPFERNKYFYGKLLSVDDFQLEQKYVNDKRRLINRFLFGTGVVAGMYVVGVDDATVSVETGMALDFSGRELIISSPVKKKLSLFEGYNSYKDADNDYGYVYLCVEYQETEKSAVHSIVGNTYRDSAEYSKISEGCRLFLTASEPDNTNLSLSSIYETSEVVYSGNGIRIRQTMPRFVKLGQSFDIKITVENMGQQQNFAFAYDLDLTCLTYEGRQKLEVSFDELLFGKAKKYEISYPVTAFAVVDTDASAVVNSESFHLTIDKTSVNATVKSENVTKIVDKDMKHAIIENYYKTAMEEIAKNNFQQSIYLAKIWLVKAGDAYVIDSIEKMPFNQYVANNSLYAAIDELLINDSGYGQGSRETAKRKESGVTGSGYDNLMMAEGICEINVDIGGQKGQRFFSEEIYHGLGVGQAQIMLNIIESDGSYLYGSSEVFQSAGPALEIAARLNPDKGVFTIGVRMLSTSVISKIRIHWTAVKDANYIVTAKNEMKIFIKPSVLNLTLRESRYLEAVCQNMPDMRIKWYVKGVGGTIDTNGMYTAPSIPGVYEVVAQSEAYENVKASIFVVVRDKNKKA